MLHFGDYTITQMGGGVMYSTKQQKTEYELYNPHVCTQTTSYLKGKSYWIPPDKKDKLSRSGMVECSNSNFYCMNTIHSCSVLVKQ